MLTRNDVHTKRRSVYGLCALACMVVTVPLFAKTESGDEIAIVTTLVREVDSSTVSAQLSVGGVDLWEFAGAANVRILGHMPDNYLILCSDAGSGETRDGRWFDLNPQGIVLSSTTPSANDAPSRDVSCTYTAREEFSIRLQFAVTSTPQHTNLSGTEVTWKVDTSEIAAQWPPFDLSEQSATTTLYPFRWLKDEITSIRLGAPGGHDSVELTIVDFLSMARATLEKWSDASANDLKVKWTTYFDSSTVRSGIAEAYLRAVDEYLRTWTDYVSLLEKQEFVVPERLLLIKRDAEELRFFERVLRRDVESDVDAWTDDDLIRTIGGYWDYLNRYPEGRGAGEARERIAALSNDRTWTCLSAPQTIYYPCEGCPRMVVVPGGKFRMGSADGFMNERPLRTVSIYADDRADGRAFAVGVHELRHKEYRRHAVDIGSAQAARRCWTYEQDESDGFTWRRRVGRHWKDSGYFVENDDSFLDDYPVVCVNWEDAAEYATSLSNETGGEFRLLSEAEWEYVARAGTTTTNGVEGHHPSPAVGVDESMDNGAGLLYANEFGVYGMLGNVWEWVQDCWRENYDDAPDDHGPRVDGDCQLRVLRGGSWADNEDSEKYLRSAMRGRSDPELRTSFTGFRVAQDLSRDWVTTTDDWYLPDGASCRPTYSVLSVKSLVLTGQSGDSRVEITAELVDKEGRSLAASTDTVIELALEGALTSVIPRITLRRGQTSGTVSFGLTPSPGQEVFIVGKGKGLVVNTVDLDLDTTQD